MNALSTDEKLTPKSVASDA